MSDDPRLFAPAAARNREPILQAVQPHLPASGTVLEIASGSGEHVACFAAAIPGLVWQPSDPQPECRASIAAWTAGLPNVLPPLALDVSADWPEVRADGVLCINMIHISPWAATVGLMAGAGRVLPPGGLLALYGPYRRTGHPIEPGNAAFDADLKQRNPAWGLRLLDDVAALAAVNGITLAETVAMPANNLLVLFRRDQASR